jgi:phage tail-like protein
MADASSPRSTAAEHPIALSQFSVVVDGLDLGRFSGCEGLSAEYSFEEIQEGGNNAFIYRLPGRVKYQNIKLTRLLTPESKKLAAWFSKFQLLDPAQRKRQDATITLWNVQGKEICFWVVHEVHPVKWTGPSFAADGTGVAKETVELAHHGFEWKP